MYLEAQVYLSQYSGGKEHLPAAHKLCADVGLPPDGNLGSVEISMHAGYWRKANAIHAWFVKHCQDGVDECQRSYVTIEKLKELRDACNTVLGLSDLDAPVPTETGRVWHKPKGSDEVVTEPIISDVAHVIDEKVAAELLPTQGGFFFGGTDYTEYYLQDLKHTIRIVDACLAAHAKNDSIVFYYHASW
jgi:hypothetical protein